MKKNYAVMYTYSHVGKRHMCMVRTKGPMSHEQGTHERNSCHFFLLLAF